MTIHSAKGLEFKVVFLIGVEDDIIPHYRSEDLEEERRLFYTAITRAQEDLYLTWAKKRRKGNKVRKKKLSRFLRELPNLEDLVECEKEGKVCLIT